MSNKSESRIDQHQEYATTSAAVFFNFVLPVWTGEDDEEAGWGNLQCNLIVTEEFWVAITVEGEEVWATDHLGGFSELFATKDNNFNQHTSQADQWLVFDRAEQAVVYERSWGRFTIYNCFGVYLVEHNRFDSGVYWTGPYSSPESAAWHCGMSDDYKEIDPDDLEAEYRLEPVFDDGVQEKKEELSSVSEKSATNKSTDKSRPDNDIGKKLTTGFQFSTFKEASYFAKLFSDSDKNSFGSNLWGLNKQKRTVVPDKSGYLVI